MLLTSSFIYRSSSKFAVLIFIILTLVSRLAADENTSATDPSTDHPDAHKNHGEDCERDKDCDTKAGMTCISNKCECHRETSYNDEKKVCLILESYSCAKKTDIQLECTIHATCEADKKVCKCMEGYSANAGNQCKGSLGTTCDVDKDPCNDLAELTCHPAEGSKEGKCACYAPQDNVFEDGRCKALAGGACVHKNPGYTIDCVGNATCMDKTDGDTTGVCECIEGHSVLADRRCGNVGATFWSSFILIVCMNLLLLDVWRS